MNNGNLGNVGRRSANTRPSEAMAGAQWLDTGVTASQAAGAGCSPMAQAIVGAEQVALRADAIHERIMTLLNRLRCPPPTEAATNAAAPNAPPRIYVLTALARAQEDAVRAQDRCFAALDEFDGLTAF